ncbi:uncharacterized protein CCR75_001178 [Bremia lactucae]|uniref:RNA polymerase II-associated protein 3 n=1 Tax=Bremia lactucae TaxID=4779 RepID=A0A976ILT1_BRELC|nr:hypothetical protein CCR75_001178 [Bremia lactucae]
MEPSTLSMVKDHVSDLYAWEKAISKNEKVRKGASTNFAVPPPREATFVTLKFSDETINSTSTSTKSLDAHTYDKGYKCQKAKTKEPSVSSPLLENREDFERINGNTYYKQGDYVAAIKSYTRCLEYNPHNTVVLSNRAMAYLKIHEYINAENDCTEAVKSDPTHVKSYMRRGTARNALGRHRLALLDFHRAATLDSKNRQIQTQLQSTRELIRTAIKRSPKQTKFSIEIKDNSNLSKQPSIHAKASIKLHESDEALPYPCSANAISSQSQVTNASKSSGVLLPKLPEKAPATSYEFGRIWKALALRGSIVEKRRLLTLRANYLRKIDPSTLCKIFKSGMESEMLCEIFHALREAVLVSTENSVVSNESVTFARFFAVELTKVPRFNMTMMLLSSTEKEDIAYVLKRTEALLPNDKRPEMANLNKLYDSLGRYSACSCVDE